jgi:hypothetical protein
MTMAVSEESGSFCSVVEDTEGVDDAVEDVIFLPLHLSAANANEPVRGLLSAGRYRPPGRKKSSRAELVHGGSRHDPRAR